MDPANLPVCEQILFQIINDFSILRFVTLNIWLLITSRACGSQCRCAFVCVRVYIWAITFDGFD